MIDNQDKLIEVATATSMFGVVGAVLRIISSHMSAKDALKVVIMGVLLSVAVGVLAHSAGLTQWLQWALAGLAGMLAKEVVSALVRMGKRGEDNSEKIADKIIDRID